MTKARHLFKNKLAELGIIFEKKAKRIPTVKEHHETIGNYSKVYLDDIEAGISYTLKQEVTLKQEILPRQLSILQSFIRVNSH